MSEYKLKKSGKNRIATIFITPLLQAGLVFLVAGTMDLPRVWLNLYVTIGYMLLAVPFLFSRYPHVIELTNRRGKLDMDAKPWDLLFVKLYLLSYLITPLAAGLEFRYAPAAFGMGYAYLGIALFLFGAMFTHWALIVNRFFETTVKVQEGQEVIQNGPYRFVRHPGYVGMILMLLAFPLITGSLYALIITLLTCVLFIFRTKYEDATLQKELKGYKEYAKKTKYRLVPYIW